MQSADMFLKPCASYVSGYMLSLQLCSLPPYLEHVRAEGVAFVKPLG